MAATAIAVVLAFPVRGRLGALAQRVVLSDRGAANDIVRNFGSHASRSVPLDDLLLHAAESLRTSLRLTSAGLWVVVGDSLALKVSDPERRRSRIPMGAAETGSVARSGVTGPAWLRVWLPELLTDRGDEPIVRAAPIAHAGELLGILVVQRPKVAEVFTEDEESALGELARQIGLTLHNAKLDSALQASLDEVRRQAQELQASRARIVEAGDTARRKIERDIHDGVQQHLVALAVKVRLAKQLQTQNPAKATEVLESLGEIERHSPGTPRSGSRDLSAVARRQGARGSARLGGPPGGIADQDRGGQHPAVQQGGGSHSLLLLPEAFQNAGKYAGSGVQVRVSVREEGDALIFTVTDDGAGFDTRAGAQGAGFTNMNDRLGAVGGTLRVESTPGAGTRVTGTIPLLENPPEGA